MASSQNKGTDTSALVDTPNLLRVYLQRMRNDSSLHDVVFIVENERFPVHRCIMAAASPVLRTMFTNGMKESNQRNIALKEVDVDVWRMVLNYVYTGQIDLVSLENALRYLECAEKFQMEELENAISSYIEKMLNASNCCKILGAVDHIGSVALRGMAMNTLLNNFYVVCRTFEFTKLSHHLVSEILSSRELVVRSELHVFLAAVNWSLYAGIGGTDYEKNAGIAKRAYEILKRNDFEIDDSNDIEPDLGDTENYRELYDCVDVCQLSNSDLRRAARFCQDLCKETQENYNVDLVHLREFGEKAVGKLLAPYNTIPNLPVLPFHRLPHGRYDTLFTFSQRFDNVQNSNCKESPVFVDKSLNVKWYLQVYFRGNGEATNKFLSCYLFTADNSISSQKDERKFGSLIYVVVDNDDGQSVPMVFSKADENDNFHNYRKGHGWGHHKLVPLSALEGKDTIVVGAAIYVKSN